MNEMFASESLSYEMRREVAIARIASYRKRFGEPHLFFAYHAAFPLALTPELLYRLWANFQRDIYSRRLHIPWVAVADLLLSNLCNEVGYELYEMDIAIRNALLTNLKAAPNFGDQRIKELSHFLLAYVHQQIDNPDPYIRDFAQVQQWAALSYTNPIDAARELARALHSSMTRNDKAEQIRIASIIETFAEPFAKSTPLLMEYVFGIQHLIRGDMEGATSQFNKIAEQEPFVQVQGVRLPIPGQVLQRLKGIPFTTIDPVQIAQPITQDVLLSRQMEPTKEVVRVEVLQQAVAAYRTSLTISTQEYAPSEWALVQNNLGISLFDLAMSLEREERAKTLYEAITCYDAAFTVYSFEKTPAEWATAQNNKGNALRFLAEILSGAVKGKMLERAITCYRSSLMVYTRDGSPLDWAKIHYNLGLSYSALPNGNRQTNLEQSILYLNESLRVFTRDDFPIDYALVQSNLGNAYCERKTGAQSANLEQALDLYQIALQVFTRDAFPIQWAAVQINLAKAYQMRIEEDWQDNLKRAIICYNHAQQIFTHDAYPDQYATINNSLNNIYQTLPNEKQPDYYFANNLSQYFSDLYFRYRDSVHKYIYKRLMDIDITEEAVQETMERAYLRLIKEPERKFENASAWLLSIARNICLEKNRIRARTDTISLEGLYDAEGSSFDLVADWDVQPEVVVIESIFQNALFTKLAQEIVHFPEKQRIALLIDLANLMHFGLQPTLLQQAFLNVGIQLENYQRPLPKDSTERSRHAAHLSLAYKRLARLASVQSYISTA